MAFFVRPRGAAVLVSVVASVAAPAARAQDGAVPSGAAGAKVVPADGTSKPGSGLLPPKIKERVAPKYPEGKLAKGEKASVKVELVIDTTGKVIDAKVVESGGAEFDAAALEAAAKLVFEPATKDGKPIKATIKWRFDFDFQDVPKEPASTDGGAPSVAPAAAALTGVVRTPVEDPLPSATVTVVGEGGVTRSAITDVQGKFKLEGLAPGKWRVRVEAEGFVAFDVVEDLAPGKRVDVVYRPKLKGGAIEIEVKGERPPREVTVHTLDQREITRIPGTNGDALRSIQNLPGVARAPGFSGFLIIRGAAPQESNIFIDGTLVPIVYHFGGLSSVVPSEMLEKIDFRPGNFGPEYGRVHGGIVDVAIRSPKKDKLHGLLQFDLIDGRLLVEGPIDDKTRFAVAGRRSWVDAWLPYALRRFGVGVAVAPVYYDWQVMLERDVTRSTTARLLFFGSNDRLAITLNTPAASDPIAGGDIGTVTGFWRLQGRTITRVTDDVKLTNTLAYGSDYVTFSLGDNYFALTGYPLSLRSDVSAKLSKEATFIAGMDYLYARYDVSLKFPPPPSPGEAAGPFFARPARELEGTGALYRPALYAMIDLQPIKGLKLLPGVRLDYFRDTSSWEVNPRFAARYDVVSGFPRTTLKGGAGVYVQPPLPNESIPPFGSTGLKPARATHYALGFEQEFTKNIELSVEGFYKDLQRLVTREAAETSTSAGVQYSNRGEGRVFGMELLFRYKPDDRFFGWIAYTLSRAERRLRPEDPMTLFIWDQTHIFTALGSYRLGKGWEVGARFRYVTGRMYTPFLGGVYDYDAGAYAPIPEVPPYQSRLPSFNQLDIRIDKSWQFTSWKLAAYLDVLNVYNRRNPEGVSYNYNYTQSDVVGGLTILPVIGLRGEM